MLAFDALIGNTDRHHENWGFLAVVKPDATIDLTACPIFDNGSSPLREMNDDKIGTRLRDRGLIDGYIGKAMAEPRWESEGVFQRMKQEMLLTNCVRQWPESRAAIEGVFSFEDASLERVIDGVASFSRIHTSLPISKIRQDGLFAVIRRRKERMLELLTKC
jgi:hypothetical protein